MFHINHLKLFHLVDWKWLQGTTQIIKNNAIYPFMCRHAREPLQTQYAFASLAS